jgi:hypothetical protein
MAGEIVKGTVNLKTVSGQNVEVVNDNDGKFYLNQIAAYNYDLDDSKVISQQNGLTTIDNETPKLAVEQGKQFVSKQVTFDANISSVNVDNIINDRINQWIFAFGERYDDFILNINPSGGNHDITIVIIRYY